MNNEIILSIIQTNLNKMEIIKDLLDPELYAEYKLFFSKTLKPKNKVTDAELKKMFSIFGNFVFQINEKQMNLCFNSKEEKITIETFLKTKNIAILETTEKCIVIDKQNDKVETYIIFSLRIAFNKINKL